jgi:hypothetical protein
MTSSLLLRQVDEAIFELAEYLHAVELGNVEPLRDKELTRDAFDMLTGYRDGFRNTEKCEMAETPPR